MSTVVATQEWHLDLADGRTVAVHVDKFSDLPVAHWDGQTWTEVSFRHCPEIAAHDSRPNPIDCPICNPDVDEDEQLDRNGYCADHAGYEDEAVNCRRPHDHCVHGKYVGGCGIDWICGYCEDGVSRDEFIRIRHADSIRRQAPYFAIVLLRLNGLMEDAPAIEELFAIVKKGPQLP